MAQGNIFKSGSDGLDINRTVEVTCVSGGGGTKKGDIVALESRNLSKVISSSSDVIYGIAQEDALEGEIYKVLIPEEYCDKTIYKIELDFQGGEIKEVIVDYKYTGKVQPITLIPGEHKLEVWGAQGGKNPDGSGNVGKGRIFCWNIYS